MKLLKYCLCLLVVSCAYTGVELVPDKMKPMVDFEKVTMVGGNALAFDITTVSDGRSDKSNIGFAKTGLSNAATPINVQGGVETYVKSRLVSGLKKRGVSLRADSAAELRVKILELKLTEEIDGQGPAERSVCQVKLQLDMHFDKEPLPKWSGQVAVKANSKGTIFDATDLGGPMLESCMNEFVEKLIREPKFQALTGIAL